MFVRQLPLAGVGPGPPRQAGTLAWVTSASVPGSHVGIRGRGRKGPGTGAER